MMIEWESGRRVGGDGYGDCKLGWGERRGEEREDWTRIWSRKTMDDVEVFERREGIERGETKDGNSRLGIEGMDWGLRI